MARPSKLTPELQQKIVALVRTGNFLETACAASGIDARTLRNWVERGKKNDKGNAKYADFVSALNVADAEAEIMFVAILHQAATGFTTKVVDGKSTVVPVSGDWKAKAFWAERRLAKRWGQKIRLQVDSAIEELLRHLRERLEPDTYQRVVDATTDFGDRAEGTDAIALAFGGSSPED